MNSFENQKIRESECNLYAKKYKKLKCTEVCPIDDAIIWVDDLY